ncbi:hypothetical protein OG948_38085 (plasmid) [Embleya sp. NBC_00888]|uniref:hypothetical protein n=1 Tax=Embleya sp. NBC_00888 TaxID=2975960 RepID=UPI002F91A029|nr:hypothetical protein OG948_38085 [Embleya sp. NBC_00888]
MVDDEEWRRIRRGLRFGQRFLGTVVGVPRPGAIGIFVDIGLAVGGFVDVLMLPEDAGRWPDEGDVAEFEVWWADDRPQIRLKPVDSRFLRHDFAERRPDWAARIGQSLPEPALGQDPEHRWK